MAALGGLLPAGRLHQARPAPRTDVQSGGLRLCLDVACALHIYLSNPSKLRLNPHFSTKSRETRIPGSGRPILSGLIQSAPGAVTMNHDAERRTLRASDRPDHRPDRLRAETPAGARQVVGKGIREFKGSLTGENDDDEARRRRPRSSPPSPRLLPAESAEAAKADEGAEAGKADETVVHDRS